MTAPDPRQSHTPPIPASQTGGSDTSRIDRIDRTDAAVPPREADALDAWLESARARPSPIAAPNGHQPDASMGDMPSLVATARDFHRRIGNAERERGPAVPETEIWERIMSDHLTSRLNELPNRNGTIVSSMAGPAPDLTEPVSVARDTPPKQRSTIVDILTGTHPAVSILLAAAVVLAILAVFRSFDETRPEPVAPTAAALEGQGGASGSNVMIPGGSGFGSSAQASATSDDCRVEELGVGDGSRPLADYAPSGTIDDPATLDEVNAALTDAVVCSNGAVTLDDFADLTAPNPQTSEEVVTFIRDNWNVDSKRFADSTLDIDTRNRLRSDATTVWIIDPATVVMLPDGRIGALAYVKDKMSTPGELGVPLFARVVVFTPSASAEPGDLVLDEIFQLCTRNGETFLCDAAPLEGSPESTPAGGEDTVSPARLIRVRPPASPMASPAAESSRWLRYPDSSDCTSQSVPAEPGTQAYDPLAAPLPFNPASPDDQLAAAEVYFQVQACEPLANLPEPQTTGANGLMTVDTSSLDSPLLSAELGFGFGQPGEPVSPELLRYVTALTDALPDQEPLDYIIEGERLPDSYSTGGYMSQSHRVLLPEDIVRLADGRIGGPTRIFYQTNDPGGAASMLAMHPFIETGFVILTVEDGRWVLDEYLPICIGDCELYWRSFRDQEWPGGTPPSVNVIYPLDATPVASLGDERATPEYVIYPLDATALPTPPAATSAASPQSGAGSEQTEVTATVELASLGASGSVILQVSSEFTEYPLDGSDARSLTTDPANPADPSLSAFETTMPNVVVVDDANGTQDLHNLETGESSETFPTFPRMHSVWMFGPYRIIGYTDSTDILVTDLRTLEIRYLSEMIGAEITEEEPEFHVRGDHNGNLFVGVTSADPARADAGSAAFVSGSLDTARPLDGWIAGGLQVNPGAISPDGSTIAYTIANGDTRALRIESADGGSVMQYQPPAGGLLEGHAFEDDRHLILFISGELRRLSIGDAAGSSAEEFEVLGSYPGHLSAFSMNPDSTSVLLSSRFGEDPPSADQWSLLDLGTGELSALPGLEGGQPMTDPGDGTPTRFVQVALDVPPDTSTPDLARAHPFVIFDLQTGKIACRGELGRWTAGSPDQSLLVGPNAGSEYAIDPNDDESPHAWNADGHLVVLDGAAGETRLIPFPDSATDLLNFQMAISPDKQHLAMTFATGPGLGTAQTWITRTDGSSGWALVGAGELVSWLL